MVSRSPASRQMCCRSRNGISCFDGRRTDPSWGPAMVVEQIHREDTLPPGARGYARDTLTLGWDDRLRVRGGRQSDGGVAFGVSLPRGSILRGGDCLVLDEAKTVIVVVERAEP